MCTINDIDYRTMEALESSMYQISFCDLFEDQSLCTCVCVSKDGAEDELFGNGDCSIEQSLENRVAERSTMNPKIE